MSDSATPWTVVLQAPWDSPGTNTGVGCRALLQGSFLTQGLNVFPASRAEGGFFLLSHQGSPNNQITNQSKE